MNPAPDAELASVGEFYHRWLVRSVTDLVFRRLEEPRPALQYRWDALLNPPAATQSATQTLAAAASAAQSTAQSAVESVTPQSVRELPSEVASTVSELVGQATDMVSGIVGAVTGGETSEEPAKRARATSASRKAVTTRKNPTARTKRTPTE
jgi:hypothetical protein